jgi:hypothetical protein
MGVAALLLVHAAIVLGGVYYMLGVFGEELDDELDKQVRQVQVDFERDLAGLQRDVRRQLRAELDARLPAPP